MTASESGHTPSPWGKSLPHISVCDADAVGEQQPGLVVLERGEHLAPPVARRRHRELEVREALVPLVVHALEHVGQPADARLAEHDAHARVRVQHAAEDELGTRSIMRSWNTVSHVPTPRLRARASVVGLTRVDRRADGVQVHDRAALVGGLPDRCELLRHSGSRSWVIADLDRGQAVARAAADLVGRGLRVLARQARDADEPLRVVGAELGEPVVVGPHDRGGHVGIGDAVRHAEHAVEHLAERCRRGPAPRCASAGSVGCITPARQSSQKPVSFMRSKRADWPRG